MGMEPGEYRYTAKRVRLALSSKFVALGNLKCHFVANFAIALLQSQVGARSMYKCLTYENFPTKQI